MTIYLELAVQRGTIEINLLRDWFPTDEQVADARVFIEEMYQARLGGVRRLVPQ